TSVLVRTYAWLVLLQRKGVINDWLLSIGVIDQPLALVHNLTGTIIGMVHVMLPFLILPLYASMKAIDPVLLRAAANCGASPSQAFRQVFLSLSMPGLASGIALTFVLCLGFYLTPALLGGGRVAMWSTQIADTVAKFSNWGAASALSVALLVVTAVILWGVRKLTDALSFSAGRP
ncbi:MAG: ABC transporter permease, partial [Shinella sp.]